MTLRAVQPTESTLIFSFLTIAARVGESGEPIQKVLTDPGLTKYWKDWGREGDVGVVAESVAAGYPVGCAWVRLFSREKPGYGYVGDDIPELGIGTIAAARGQGVGTRVMGRLLDVCRGRFGGVSLSVRKNNPAIRLYERLGFQRVPGSPSTNRVETESIVMLLRFEG